MAGARVSSVDSAVLALSSLPPPPSSISPAIISSLLSKVVLALFDVDLPGAIVAVFLHLRLAFVRDLREFYLFALLGGYFDVQGGHLPP